MKGTQYLLTASVLLSLAACGGGSGTQTASSGTTTQPPATLPPVIQPPSVEPPNLQTSVPAATYAANSQELVYFTAYNDFRAKMGLGLLKQDSNLDTAAKNHLAYLTANPDLDLGSIDPASKRPLFHMEDPKRPRFTGVEETERGRFAGYAAGFVGESGGYGNGQGAARALGDLLATIYHRSGLMFQGAMDIGLTIGNDPFQTMVIEVGFTTKTQYNGGDYVGTYPADKQTGVRMSAYKEIPSPFADIAQEDYSKHGYPINIAIKEGRNLTITSFTVTESGQTTALPSRLISRENDTNRLLPQNIAFLMADAKFKPNTTYNVKFAGANNGANLTREWSFTTGAN